jgi:hypothetical protein
MQQQQMNMPLIQPPPPPEQSPTTPHTVNNPNIIRNLTQFSFPGEFSYTCAQRASRLQNAITLVQFHATMFNMQILSHYMPPCSILYQYVNF